MKVEKMAEIPGVFNSNDRDIMRRGLFRIYDNYIETDKLRFFGSVEGTEIVHRNDITSV